MTFRKILKVKLAIIILSLFLFTSWGTYDSRKIKSTPVDFIIRKIILDEEQNNMKMLLDLELAHSDFSSATGALSFCGCYCDSLWPAWPPPSDDNLYEILGEGTFHYVEFNGLEGLEGNRTRSGVLGIGQVEGGIERTTEFNLAIDYQITKK